VTEDLLHTIDQDQAGSDEMFEHFRLVADKGQAPVRVDRFIAEHQEDTSRSRVQNAIKLGYVLVNDAPVKANYIIRPCDVVKFVMPYERRGLEILPENIPLDIVYEDEDVLVVNKPAGMVVHPGHGNYNGTLVNALAFHLGLKQEADAQDERMGVLVHRIDKDTSGLLVVAKNPPAQLNLADQFFVHSIDRVYTAVVWGNLAQDEGTVEGIIGRDPNDRLRFRVFDEKASGPLPTGGCWNAMVSLPWWNAAWRRAGRTRSACTWPPWAIRCSTTSVTAGPKSARAPFTPSIGSSSRIALPCARARPCMPAPWASPIPAPGSASSLRPPSRPTCSP